MHRPTRTIAWSRRPSPDWPEHRFYDAAVVAAGGGTIGAIAGLIIGIALSMYVAMLDYRKRQEGLRTRAQYRLSLFAVPVILALIGGIIGAAIAD
jgi:hypothetical protein